MWLPYRLTQLLPTRSRLRKVWYSSFAFRSQRELKRRLTIAAQSRQPSTPLVGNPTVTLVRVIGNDLYPRHRQGQALRNLQTILREESNLEGWTKLFVLNRLIDPRVEAEAVAAIRDAGHDYELIPFDQAAYRVQRYHPELFGGLDYFSSSDFSLQDPFSQDRQRIWACGDKIRYLMNINGARNAALACGRRRSDWTFVLDGSCIVPDRVFDRLRLDLRSLPSVPYLILPMRRLAIGSSPEQADCSPTFKEEPQIAFRSDAVERFDPAYPYGVRDKTSLLNRLGVPGPWCGWAPMPWHPEAADRSVDRYRFKYASASVLRLTSGIDNGDLELPAAQMRRYRSRIRAIFFTLMLMDRQCSAPDASLLPVIADLPEELLNTSVDE